MLSNKFPLAKTSVLIRRAIDSPIDLRYKFEAAIGLTMAINSSCEYELDHHCAWILSICCEKSVNYAVFVFEFGRMADEEEEVMRDDSTKEMSDSELDKIKAERRNKKRKRLLEEAAKAKKRGVCYLSRVPPRMDPLKLRHILSQFGDIERIWLTPENPAAQVHRKNAGGFRGQGFTEGWVEFTNKHVAKRVASMLNGEQIGGKKKSSFYYDLWNIKYLSKFKWDHLTEEIAYKNATREQKLALELSAAKKERDFYLSKVDQSRALSSIDERLKKKRKIQQANGTASEIQGDHQQAAKVIRQFPQTKPVRDGGEKQKQGLSKDLLAGVFGGSS
ncbi:hypothetical protein QVD17_21495 [Tagetes erecta]|uniref:RRM domain-containing protein n=1 Tax=Tagetes erecta TaxID=13708 RepID=A0AAD8KEJ4_TARER|nr:hypothetical protein QVD17_21495 [Tagetes erecta]